MDQPTDAFYRRYAERLATQPESPRSAMLPFLLRALPAGSRVLDVGAGAGRDVAALLAEGREAYGIEPSADMRARAAAQFPELDGRLRDGALPALGRPFDDVVPQGFDGVVCSAVLMHVSAEGLPATLAALAAVLRRAPDDRGPAVGTVLLLAVPEQVDGSLVEGRDIDGRRFENHAPSRVAELLAPTGLALAEHAISDAVLVSVGTRWHTLVFRA